MLIHTSLPFDVGVLAEGGPTTFIVKSTWTATDDQALAAPDQVPIARPHPLADGLHVDGLDDHCPPKRRVDVAIRWVRSEDEAGAALGVAVDEWERTFVAPSHEPGPVTQAILSGEAFVRLLPIREGLITRAQRRHQQSDAALTLPPRASVRGVVVRWRGETRVWHWPHDLVARVSDAEGATHPLLLRCDAVSVDVARALVTLTHRAILPASTVDVFLWQKRLERLDGGTASARTIPCLRMREAEESNVLPAGDDVAPSGSTSEPPRVEASPSGPAICAPGAASRASAA